MNAIVEVLPAALFFILGAIAIASSILVVSLRNPVHSALFLLVTFLSVAVLFFMQGAEFVGAVQILVYAGGIMVLFLFVVMLVNVASLRQQKMYSSFVLGGLAVGFAVFFLLAWVASTGVMHPVVDAPNALRTAPVDPAWGDASVPEIVGNSEAVGLELYRKYLVPFEVASLFLLVAMIGAIVIGKRELSAAEEEQTPEFVRRRVAEEKKVKEALGA